MKKVLMKFPPFSPMLFPIAKRLRIPYRPATTFISNDVGDKLYDKETFFGNSGCVSTVGIGGTIGLGGIVGSVAAQFLRDREQEVELRNEERELKDVRVDSVRLMDPDTLKVESLKMESVKNVDSFMDTLKTSDTFKGVAMVDVSQSEESISSATLYEHDELHYTLQSIISHYDAHQNYIHALLLSKLPHDPKRLGRICELFESAALEGHVESAFNAGLCYDPRSKYSLNNINKAIMFYKLASMDGHKRAQFRLGMLLLLVCKDEKGLFEAIEWIKKSANEYEPAKRVLDTLEQLQIVSL